MNRFLRRLLSPVAILVLSALPGRALAITCASDADCAATPATPTCEVWGACGQCSATNLNACTGGTDICDFPTGTCVACEFNADCAGTTPICDQTSHACQPCMNDSDCVGNLGGPSCETSGMKAGSCVICSVDADCTSAAAPRCDTVANLCVACLTSADCMAPTPVCDSSKICVGCTQSSDCSGATPICDTSTSTCAGCQNDHAMSNPGSLACPTPALPACQPTGSPLAGQCTICSSLNGSVCATLAMSPLCVDPTTTPTCGCAQDSDCDAGSYCDTSTVATGQCKAGCRVVGADGGMGGTANCPTDGGSAPSGVGGGEHLPTQSVGCGCKVASSNEDGTRLAALAALVAALGMIRGRHTSRRSR